MNNSKKLILVGSRRNLSDLVLTAKDAGFEIVGILDKHYYGNTDVIDGIPVIGSEDDLLKPDHQWQGFDFFPANWWDGNQDLSGQGLTGEQLRKERIAVLEKSGVNVVNIIHPSVKFYFNSFNTIPIGRGNLIMPECMISNHASIGNYNVFDWDCGIGFQSYIHNNVIIGAHTQTSHVKIFDNSRIGVGCILVPRKTDYLNIGPDSVVYIGTTCTVSVPPNSVFTMHRKIKKRISQKLATAE